MRSAEELLSVVTAASQAIESWFAVGDPSVALQAVEGALSDAELSPEVRREADGLTHVFPAPVLQVVSDRVSRHWRAYERALADELSTEQTQAIHFALLACLNKELESLRSAEHGLPPGVMKSWWVEYS